MLPFQGELGYGISHTQRDALAIIERGFQPLIKRKIFIITKIDSFLNGTQVNTNFQATSNDIIV